MTLKASTKPQQMLITWKHPKLNIVIKLLFFSLLFSQNYMMFVSWSDQNNILIYRTFEDFKKFHVSEFSISQISRFLSRGGEGAWLCMSCEEM